MEVLSFFLGLTLGLSFYFWRINQVKKEASKDTLTGLYNRVFLDKTLGRLLALAKREKKSLSLLMIDLDDFKAANDRYGHQFGDKVLRNAAEAIASSLRASDFVFRFGGDEFLVILPSTSQVGAKGVAEKIVKNVGKLAIKAPQGGEVKIGASVGISTYPEQDVSDTELVSLADEALYKAKKEPKHIKVAE